MRKAIKAILIIVAVIVLIIAFLVILPLLKPDIVPRNGNGGDKIEDKTIEYIKVDDFFGEWPIYYDEHVEFEGYVTSVYECMPPERCLKPYFLVYKEPLPYRYYSMGQVIVKHTFGEELEEGKKYKIRGRLLPPEQAFLIEIVGTLPNAESRIVIDPTEPAIKL